MAGELAPGERIQLIKVTIEVMTTMRHPPPLTVEWGGHIGDDFWEFLQCTITNKLLDMFSK
jgi:hypothetical protein